jgi:hypothetical protein
MILVDERSLQSILVHIKQEACLVSLSSKGSTFVQILIAIEANTNRELGCLNDESERKGCCIDASQKLGYPFSEEWGIHHRNDPDNFTFEH